MYLFICEYMCVRVYVHVYFLLQMLYSLTENENFRPPLMKGRCALNRD